MVMISSSGQTVRISMRDLRVMGRNTQGVKLVNLREGDGLVAVQKIEDTAEVVIEASLGDAKPILHEKVTQETLEVENVEVLKDNIEFQDEMESEEDLQEINVSDDELN